MRVEILDTYGDDLSIANTARVSYGKVSSELSPADIKLLSYLWSKGHTSPFRHAHVRCRIQCPIFVERQWFKHKLGIEVNSISGRYVDFSDSYWIPTELRLQATDSKQGSSENRLHPDEEERLIFAYARAVDACKGVYNDMVTAGVAKELARTVLPLSLNTEFIWTGSLQACFHLFDLRLKPDAQKETRILAGMLLEELEKCGQFEYSLKAWKESKK